MILKPHLDQNLLCESSCIWTELFVFIIWHLLCFSLCLCLCLWLWLWLWLWLCLWLCLWLWLCLCLCLLWCRLRGLVQLFEFLFNLLSLFMPECVLFFHLFGNIYVQKKEKPQMNTSIRLNWDFGKITRHPVFQINILVTNLIQPTEFLQVSFQNLWHKSHYPTSHCSTANQKRSIMGL